MSIKTEKKKESTWKKVGTVAAALAGLALVILKGNNKG